MQRIRVQPIRLMHDNQHYTIVDESKGAFSKKIATWDKCINEQKTKLQLICSQKLTDPERKLYDNLTQSRENLLSTIDKYYDQCFQMIRTSLETEIIQLFRIQAQKINESLSIQSNYIAELQNKLSFATESKEFISQITNSQIANEIKAIMDDISTLENNFHISLPRIVVWEQFIENVNAEIQKYVTIAKPAEKSMSCETPKKQSEKPYRSLENSPEMRDSKSPEKKIFSKSPMPLGQLSVSEDPILNDINFREMQIMSKRKRSDRSASAGVSPNRSAKDQRGNPRNHSNPMSSDRISHKASTYGGESYNANGNHDRLKVNSERKSALTAALEVKVQNYFEKNCKKQFLHFFQDNSKTLHLFDLASLDKAKALGHRMIEMDISFKIPIWHRSIITPTGDLYLTGGCDTEGSTLSLRSTYSFEYGNNRLFQLRPMNVGRNSHGICYFQGSLFVVGGCVDDEGYSTSCEALDVSKGPNSKSFWKRISDLNHPAYAPCLVNFNDKMIFKFGGLLKIDTPNNSIEIYSPEKNFWLVASYSVQPDIFQSSFNIPAFCCGVQVSSEQIYIFGGSENGELINSTFLLSTESTSRTHEIQFPTARLPSSGAFWNCNGVIKDNRIYALQNIQSERKQAFLFAKRKILCFEDRRWHEVSFFNYEN